MLFFLPRLNHSSSLQILSRSPYLKIFSLPLCLGIATNVHSASAEKFLNSTFSIKERLFQFPGHSILSEKQPVRTIVPVTCQQRQADYDL